MTKQEPNKIPPWGYATIITMGCGGHLHGTYTKKALLRKEKSQHDNKERKTRLELATPTLARLC
ncbi:MAG: hypothetical protein Q4E44_10210, partial [bacterium]|nr:hypothetical protein [bacterium]